jgi:hypothetical protein
MDFMEETQTPLDTTLPGLDNTVEAQWIAYRRAQDAGHRRYVAEAKLFDKYYVGEQWDDDVVAKLDREFRPHHTVNLVLSTVNSVLGQYVSTRQDIEYKPVSKGATYDVGCVLTKVARHISDDSHSRWIEKQVFTDGCIQDRGFFDIRLDTEENIAGEIRETALDPVDVLLDPGAREYDPSTWNEVFITRWMTPDQIAAMYGEEFGDKIRYLDANSTYGTDSVLFDPETFSRDRSYYSQGAYNYNYGDEFRRVRQVRVIERQYYKFTLRQYFVDNLTGDLAPVPDSWSKDKVQQVSKLYNLSILQKPERRIKWCVTCDKFSLRESWSPYRRFTVIPFFPYFRRGRPFGIVRNLISPQDLLNKVSSQELHVVNTTANSGWLVESGSLVNMTTQELTSWGAKTGIVLEFARGSSAPEKIQPNQIPTGLDRLSQKATVYFREISGISDAMLGTPGREISGEALDRKTSNTLLQLDTVFDNLAFTRKLRAEMILELIQDFYTEERIITIVNVNEDGDEYTEDVRINIQKSADEILNDVTVGEYRVVVSSRPSRDVEDESQLQLMLQMREQGIVIPDWAIIGVSPLENRRELAEWNKKITGAAAPTPEEIQYAAMQQELELRRQMAEVDELAARSQERMANAAKLMAEAEAVGETERAAIVKFGAELRASMERDILEFNTKRGELLARIQIAAQKNKSAEYQAQLGALTKRLDTEAKERIESVKAAAQVSAARGYGHSFNGKR